MWASATLVAGNPEIFADENFTDPNITLDNVEITAGSARLLVTPESWTQTTKADFERWVWDGDGVAIDPGGVRLASTGGGWSALENAPYSSSYGVATVGAGRYVFILRGYYSGVKVGVGRYDTTTGSWENWSDPTIEWREKKQYFKNGCAMAWDNGDYVYVLAGGSYGDVPNPSDPSKYEPRYGFWRFRVDDPSSWTRLENTPWWQGPGDCLTWARVGGENYIYAWLGTTSRGSKANPAYIKFYRYQITSSAPDGIGKWETTPIKSIAENGIREYPYGGDDGASLVWTGGNYIYYMPGAVNESASGDAEFAWGRFVISENRWENLAQMPVNENPNTTEVDGVDDGGSAVWGGGDLIYVLKGGDAGGNVPAENFYGYSIGSNSWEVLAGVPLGPHSNNGPRLGYAAGRVYYWHANSTRFWVQEPPQYVKSGWFESKVFDAGTTVTWQQVSWRMSSPAGVTSEKKFVSAEPLSLMSGEDRLGLLPAEGIATHVVISEVSPTSDPGEYVVLYNPTETPFNLSGWYLNVYKNDYTFGADDVIPAHGYFLISDTNPVCGVAADVFRDIGMADDGAGSYVQLRSGGADGPIIDQVGWGTSSIFEGALAKSPGKGKVLVRKSGPTHEGGNGNGYDTDNNANDFFIAEPNPKNRSSPGEIPPAYAATYLNTRSRDGVYEEISEENISTPAVGTYHEENTTVVVGTFSSGSPNNLDSDDQIYYEVNAAFSGGGIGTENLYEASTDVENGTEASGTSTANLDADDAAYYEVDAASSPGEEGSNLVQNPGFETGDFTNWTKVGTTGSITATNEKKHSGSYSAKFTDLTTAYSGRGIRSDNVSVTAGNQYSFGAWFYVPSVTGATIDNYMFRCRIEWRYENGDLISSDPGTTGWSLAAFDTWEKKEWLSQAPAGAAKASLFIDAKRKSSSVPTDNVYVDDAKIAEVTSAYSIDLRHNSGAVTTPEASIDSIQVTVNFKSSAAATYHFEIYNFNSGQWESGQSGSVGTTEVSWTVTKTSNPGYYVDDSTHVARVRLWTAGESSAHRLREDFLVFKVNYTAPGAYALEVRHDSAPVSPMALDEIQVTLNFRSENAATYNFEIYNFTSGQWESGQSGSVGASEATWTINKTANPVDYISPGGAIRVRLRTFSESTPHRLQEDCLEFKVSSTSSRYRLLWEYRLTGVESSLEGCRVKIYGYNATRDESVTVSIWRSSAGRWETLAELPLVPGEISYTLTSIDDYLVGSQIAIKLEDANNSDAIPTRVRIDYVALEAEKPKSVMLRLKVRGSPDNVAWPDWWDVPYIFSGSRLPYECRYFQYLIELFTEDNMMTPVLHELNLSYFSTATTSTGTFVSQPLELGYIENWATLSWSGDVPENTSISFATRSSVDGLTWSEWAELDSEAIRSPTYGCRYLQVRATFRGVGTATPTLYGYGINYTPDQTPPLITLDEPGQGFVTDSGDIVLRGQLRDANPVTLEVNGKPMSLVLGSFEVPVELSSGQNTIRLVATDAAGNRIEFTLTGTYSPWLGRVKLIAAGLAVAIGAVVGALWATGRLRFGRPKVIVRRVKGPTPLMREYERETGGRAMREGKPTKGYLEWRERKLGPPKRLKEVPLEAESELGEEYMEDVRAIAEELAEEPGLKGLERVKPARPSKVLRKKVKKS